MISIISIISITGITSVISSSIITYVDINTCVSTYGVTANLMFFDRGTFGELPLTYVYLPKSARAYLSLQSAKMKYFCSGPISVDPSKSATKGRPR